MLKGSPAVHKGKILARYFRMDTYDVQLDNGQVLNKVHLPEVGVNTYGKRLEVGTEVMVGYIIVMIGPGPRSNNEQVAETQPPTEEAKVERPVSEKVSETVPENGGMDTSNPDDPSA